MTFTRGPLSRSRHKERQSGEQRRGERDRREVCPVENRLVQQRYAFLPAAVAAASALHTRNKRPRASGRLCAGSRGPQTRRAHGGTRSDNMYTANIQYYNTHTSVGAETQEGRSLRGEARRGEARLSGRLPACSLLRQPATASAYL